MPALADPTKALGSSQLVIPVPLATEATSNSNRPWKPKQMVPAGGSDPAVKGGLFAMPFQVPAGFQVAIRRIHRRLPAFIEEVALEKIEGAASENLIGYATEAEAKEAAIGKGGFTGKSTTQKPISPTSPYESTVTTARAEWNPGGKSPTLVLEQEFPTVYKSVLPATLEVITAIIGPDGIVWSGSEEITVRYYAGRVEVAGETPIAEGKGQGFLDVYDDLQNPLVIDPSRVHGLGLYVRLASTTTRANLIQLGVELDNNAVPQESANSDVTLFYDIEPKEVQT